jgi:gas vesicle protein
MGGQKGFSYFWFGMGIGVGLGLLFAPRTGSETRENLWDAINTAGEELADRGRELYDRQRDNIEQIRESALRVMESAAELAGDNPTRPKGRAGGS